MYGYLDPYKNIINKIWNAGKTKSVVTNVIYHGYISVAKSYDRDAEIYLVKSSQFHNSIRCVVLKSIQPHLNFENFVDIVISSVHLTLLKKQKQNFWLFWKKQKKNRKPWVVLVLKICQSVTKSIVFCCNQFKDITFWKTARIFIASAKSDCFEVDNIFAICFKCISISKNKHNYRP